MSFLSATFFAFVLITLLVYFFCVPKKYQWCVLLAASYVFYAFAGWNLLFYMLFTTCTVFFSASRLHMLKSQKGRKCLIALVIIGNFSILAFFKWFNALAGIGNRVLDIVSESAFSIPTYSLLLPLGISFYTFQAIGYLIDIYRGVIKPETNIARFALFVSFFPQLIQGPISRHDQLAGQLFTSRYFNYVEARRGLQLVVWGMFKKMVIADRLVLMTETIFSDLDIHNGLYVLVGVVVASIRNYTDFSGGIDIARGTAQMFGIIMPENFKRPYFATSLPDFWRRWHITLNNWWRDYVFYPIVLSKPMTYINRFTRKKINRNLGKVISIYIALFLVRVINGMWHGADLFFIARGLFDGVFLTLGVVLAPVFVKTINKLHINPDCFSWRLFRIVRTFLIVSFARLFIEAGSVMAGIRAMGSIITDFNPWILNVESIFVGLNAVDLNILFVSLLIVLVVSILQEKGIAIRETLEKQNIVFQWIVLLGGIFAIILWGKYGFEYDSAGFLYEGF